MTGATNGTNATTPLPTPAELERTISQMAHLFNSLNWVLMSPRGEVWAGQPEVLLQVLMLHHPLLKSMPLSKDAKP